jgi:hypothetical protein
MQSASRKSVLKGSLLGALASAFAIGAAVIQEGANLPSVLDSVFEAILTPFLFPAALITWAGIVGDDYQPADFLRYVVPITFAINMVLGGLLGWGIGAFKSRTRTN